MVGGGVLPCRTGGGVAVQGLTGRGGVAVQERREKDSKSSCGKTTWDGSNGG